MNLEKIRELVEKDMVVDNTELATESTKIPQLHNKYLNIFMVIMMSKLHTKHH